MTTCIIKREKAILRLLSDTVTERVPIISKETCILNLIIHLNVIMEEVPSEHHLPSTSRHGEMPFDASSGTEVECIERSLGTSNHRSSCQNSDGNVAVNHTSTGLSEGVPTQSELSHVVIEQALVDTHFSNASGYKENPANIQPDDVENHVESLLGTADQGDTRRNYDVYNRMEGCSSDEETQTDNDDDNSIENEAETITEHHYAVLNDDPEFGDFTGADNYTVENLCHEDDDNDWAQPVTGASVSLSKKGNEASSISSDKPGFTATFFDQASSVSLDADTDGATQQSLNPDGNVAPTPIPKFVSIQPLSAGIDDTTYF